MGILVFGEEGLLEEVVWGGVVVSSHDFVEIEHEKWGFGKVLLGQHWLVALLDFFQVEDGLPLGVWLVTQPKIC